jgi:hypothetical protein
MQPCSGKWGEVWVEAGDQVIMANHWQRATLCNLHLAPLPLNTTINALVAVMMDGWVMDALVVVGLLLLLQTDLKGEPVLQMQLTGACRYT